MDAGLSKKERICSQKAIGQLVAGGHYVVSGPLRCCYRVREDRDDDPVNRILVSVPKKHFKRAVWRNRLKRRIREAYRLQKSLLKPRAVDIMLFHSARQAASFEEIRDAVAKVLGTIDNRLSGQE